MRYNHVCLLRPWRVRHGVLRWTRHVHQHSGQLRVHVLLGISAWLWRHLRRWDQLAIPCVYFSLVSVSFLYIFLPVCILSAYLSVSRVSFYLLIPRLPCISASSAWFSTCLYLVCRVCVMCLSIYLHLVCRAYLVCVPFYLFVPCLPCLCCVCVFLPVCTSYAMSIWVVCVPFFLFVTCHLCLSNSCVRFC